MHSGAENRYLMNDASGVEKVYRPRTSITSHNIDQNPTRNFWGVGTLTTLTVAGSQRQDQPLSKHCVDYPGRIFV